MKKIFLNWIPVIILSGGIYLLSSFPTTGLLPWGWDKVIHFLEYALLGFFVTRGVLLTWDLSKGWGVAFGAILTASFGALDEFHQSFVPYREASLWDGVANAFGAVAGSILFIRLGILLYRSHKLYPSSKTDCG